VLRLLLLVSRRSSRSRLLRAPVRGSTTSRSSSNIGVPALSLLRATLGAEVRLIDLEVASDPDLELESRRLRDLRDLAGGEGLINSEVDLLGLGGGGDREMEASDCVGDLRWTTRSGLLPLALSLRPL